MVVTARKGTVSYKNALEFLPDEITRHFSGTNIMIIFPDQHGDAMDEMTFAQPQQQDEEQEDAGKVNALFHRHGAAAVGTPHAEQAAPDTAEPARKHGRTDEAGQEQRQRVFELQRNT